MLVRCRRWDGCARKTVVSRRLARRTEVYRRAGPGSCFSRSLGRKVAVAPSSCPALSRPGLLALAFGEINAGFTGRLLRRRLKRARTGRLIIWSRDDGPSRRGLRLVHLGWLLVLILLSGAKALNTLRRSPCLRIFDRAARHPAVLCVQLEIQIFGRSKASVR
jgi:hypothetical protein